MEGADRTEDFKLQLGAELKAEIARAGLRHKVCAEAIDVHPVSFSRYLNGTRDMPISVLFSLCSYLGVDVAQVVENAERRLATQRGTPTDTRVGANATRESAA